MPTRSRWLTLTFLRPRRGRQIIRPGGPSLGFHRAASSGGSVNGTPLRKGPYKGDELSVDHIIPRAVVPELDNVIANLELMPLRMNESKNDRVGARQLDLARKRSRPKQI
jgi:hypothetical protein